MHCKLKDLLGITGYLRVVRSKQYQTKTNLSLSAIEFFGLHPNSTIALCKTGELKIKDHVFYLYNRASTHQGTHIYQRMSYNSIVIYLATGKLLDIE